MWPMRLAQNASSHFSYDAVSVWGNSRHKTSGSYAGAPNYPLKLTARGRLTGEFAGLAAALAFKMDREAYSVNDPPRRTSSDPRADGAMRLSAPPRLRATKKASV